MKLDDYPTVDLDNREHIHPGNRMLAHAELTHVGLVGPDILNAQLAIISDARKAAQKVKQEKDYWQCRSRYVVLSCGFRHVNGLALSRWADRPTKAHRYTVSPFLNKANLLPSVKRTIKNPELESQSDSETVSSGKRPRSCLCKKRQGFC